MNDNKNNSPGNFKITGDWAAQSKTLKSRFSQLTDSDLQREPGKDHEVLDRVQKRLSKSREEAIRIVNGENA